MMRVMGKTRMRMVAGVQQINAALLTQVYTSGPQSYQLIAFLGFPGGHRSQVPIWHNLLPPKPEFQFSCDEDDDAALHTIQHPNDGPSQVPTPADDNHSSWIS